MARSVTQIAQKLYKLDDDGKAYLAILLGSAAKSRATRQFAEGERNVGLLVEGNKISRWESVGMIELDGNIYFYGPYVEGRTVQEVFEHSPENALQYVLRLARALLLVEEKEEKIPAIQTDGMLFLDDGGVLFLPASIMERIRNTQAESERLESYELFNNPGLPAEENLSFAMGVFCYRIFTGRFPFAGESVEEIHEKMRHLRIPEPRLIKPELRPQVSKTVIESLRQDLGKAGSIESWIDELAKWVREGVRAEISVEDKARILDEATKAEKRMNRAFGTREYFQQNWRKLAIIVGVVAVIGIVGGSILSNVLKPRVTLGKTPLQVVQLFYTSITTMNSEAIQACLAKHPTGVAQEAVNEATNLYVISRVRLGQEGSSGYVSPEQWIKSGSPTLPASDYVYGIGDLSITKDNDTTFTAKYTKYEQATSDSDKSLVGPKSHAIMYRRTDVLHLRWDGKYWVIYQIDRTQDQTVKPGS